MRWSARKFRAIVSLKNCPASSSRIGRSPRSATVRSASNIWNGWAFDHSGWNREGDLLAANADFEGGPLEVVEIDADLAEFCDEHYSRMPHQYWRDPRPRARAYLGLHSPPWAGAPAP